MSNWLRNNVGSVAVQIAGVLIMGLIALGVSRTLDNYVKMDEWKARNISIDLRFDALQKSISDNLKSLQDLVAGNSAQYVTAIRWAERNAIYDDRFDKIDRMVQEGRAERMVFQKEAIEKLTRIEMGLIAHAAAEGKAVILKP